RKLLQEVFAHPIEGKARIDHVINKQYLAIQGAPGDGDELGNIQLSLLRTRRFAVAAGSQYTKGDIKHAGQDVSDTHATPGQTSDFLKLPAGVCDQQRQSFYRAMLVVPADSQIAIGIGRQMAHDAFLSGCVRQTGCGARWFRPDPGRWTPCRWA